VTTFELNSICKREYENDKLEKCITALNSHKMMPIVSMNFKRPLEFTPSYDYDDLLPSFASRFSRWIHLFGAVLVPQRLLWAEIYIDAASVLSVNLFLLS
jgi:hypothetical protein